MKTAMSERLIETIVKPISDAPSIAACDCRFALLPMSVNVFQHDDRVVHDEADRDAEAHQRQVV